MIYTLLDAAYALHYSKAEFAKNPFRKKKKPGMLKRARQVVLGKSKRGFAARVVGAGALLGGDQLLRRNLNNKLATASREKASTSNRPRQIQID